MRLAFVSDVRRRSIWLLVALCAGCHGARGWVDERSNGYCGDRPSRPALGDGASADLLCEAIATALCEQWARCGCIDAPSVSGCHAHVLTGCAEYVDDPSIASALARGTLTWSGAEASRFLGELASATSACEPVDLDLSGAGVGRVPDLSPCTDIDGAFSECSDGSSCQIWGLGGPRGQPAGRYCTLDTSVTGRFQRDGEACDGYGGSGCGPGLRCAPVCGGSQFEGRCTSQSPIGASCRWDVDCTSGYCASPVGADPYPYSRHGVCALEHAVPLGEPCTSVRDCTASRCVLPFSLQPEFDPVAAGTCEALLDDGVDCAYDGECASGACGGFRLVSRPRCADTGARCDPDHPSCVCIVSESLGICGAVSDVGEPCRSDAACTTHLCRSVGGMESTCITPPPAPSLADLGAPCVTPAECASSSCTGGVCSPAVCTARLDPTGHGRFWLHPPLFVP